MAKDHINVNVAHLGRPADVSEAEAIHSVGASHLGEYLQMMVGEGVPAHPEDRNAADQLLGRLAMFSLDDELFDLWEKDQFKVVPHWIKRLSPIVGRTRTVGKRIEAHLMGEIEPKPHPQDTLYLIGLFDIASFVITQQLGIVHPLSQNEQLLERAANIRPVDQEPTMGATTEEAFGMDLLINLPLLPFEYRRQLNQLRRQGELILEKAQLMAGVMREVGEKNNPDI